MCCGALGAVCLCLGFCSVSLQTEQGGSLDHLLSDEFNSSSTNIFSKKASESIQSSDLPEELQYTVPKFLYEMLLNASALVFIFCNAEW
jgi:hypothetical protein